MVSNLTFYLVESLIGLIFGLALWLIERKYSKRSDVLDRQMQYYIKSQQLQLQMLMANSNLTYAVAMAVKRGTPNGEVETAIADYLAAKKEYEKFLTDRAVTAVTGIIKK